MCIRDRSITRGDKFLQTQSIKFGGEIFCEVTPFGVITRQKDCLASEYIGIIFKIGIHFHLNIVVLSVKFIVLSGLCCSEVFVCHRTMNICHRLQWLLVNKKKSGSLAVARSAIRGLRTAQLTGSSNKDSTPICEYPKPISSKILEMSRIGIYIPVASIVALSFGEFSECPKFRITKNKRQYTLSYVRPPSRRFS